MNTVEHYMEIAKNTPVGSNFDVDYLSMDPPQAADLMNKVVALDYTWSMRMNNNGTVNYRRIV